MKKILVLLLAFALLACTFVACGEEKPTETEAPSGTAAPSATEAPSETEAPSTEAPSTEAPSTEAPSTEAPSTEAPSTEAPSTEAPSTEAPSTEAPSTEAPSTEAPSTEAPSTEAPSTEAPSTEAPSTEAPSTEAPSTEAPSTEAPSTEAPSTEAPSTEAPSTEAPSTEAPSTEAPSTEAPSTEVPSTEAPSTEAPTDEGGEDDPGLDEYENRVLLHTPVLDGVLDEEYYLSYHFDCPQYSETVPGYEDQPNAFSNRATVYVLWDSEYVYFAVEIYDNDMMARDPAYLIWHNEKDDVNPYYNDSAELWYSFELAAPESKTDVKKLCYDAYGQGEGPFSAINEGIYSNHFQQSEAAAKYVLGYDPEDEEGFCDRAVIEFKIPAKSESNIELYEGDPIYFAVQINDIAEATAEELTEAGLDPDNLDPTVMEGIGSGYTFTYSRAAQNHFPKDGELNGYAMGTLTTITPASLGE